MKDIKALSKMAIKVDSAYSTAVGKPLKRQRLMKQAVSIDKRLTVAMHKFLPPTATRRDVHEELRQVLSWVQNRIDNRVGHTPQNPVPRTERRRIARVEAKQAA